jgi:hypothetical protein
MIVVDGDIVVSMELAGLEGVIGDVSIVVKIVAICIAESSVDG